MAWPPSVVMLGDVAREDSLPERARYRDTGCHVHPSCLECPLARCIYDGPGSAPNAKSDARRAEIVRRYESGEGVVAIARELGVSPRTVWRHLRIEPPKEPRQRSRKIAFEHAGWR